jgi:8-oxo-dGTP diphosphatase
MLAMSQSVKYEPAGSEFGHPRPAVTVDLVLMSIVDGTPAVLLIRRDDDVGGGQWALPGGFVHIDEAVDTTAERILRDKAHMSGAYVEQLFTFGRVNRDPRMRVITVAYFGLLPPEHFTPALKGHEDLMLACVDVPWSGEIGGAVKVLGPDGELTLAFDHADILATAILRLRGKLDYSPVGFALLPEQFTLRQLQDVHEAILGTKLNKPAFRRRMLDRGWLNATGTREIGSSYRPAELFRHRPN